MIVLWMYNSFYFDEPTQRSCVTIWIWTIFDFAIVSKLPHSNYHYLHVIIPHRLFHIDYSQGFKQGLYYHFKGLLEISELYYDTHYDYYYTLCSTEAKVTPIDWWSKISCVTHLYGPSDYKKSWVLKICRRKFFFIFEDTKIERALLFSKSTFKQVFLQFLVLLMWSHSILIIDLSRYCYVDVFT